MLDERPVAELKMAHRLELPVAPESESGAVKAWSEPVSLFTFLPGKPDINPMFLENRVYQGSSGRVYPLPFIDRIATEGEQHRWQAVHLENEYLRVMILPEIGGRIHLGLDKINGYDFFYRQNVIKPALVGLAGPWISGGVEFNWPQHHRPATFMPVEVEIEREPDGSITVWCSDHDPMNRMKGMHGVCLHPGASYLEVKVRLYNRTALEQTFLWWANAAARVHERYQSFFPADVRYVADHAKRAITQFPYCAGSYYGVDYAERARLGVPEEEQPRLYRPDGSYAANDLSWYANIPVPTSYMIVGTDENFFGGYDHAVNAGMVHVANHHIAPGKKQWTWGNQEFGYAWDRNLTESDGPYIELMAGVYTDNQPDFSFLAPGETKTFSQFWYPIRRIGVPQAANVDAALSLRLSKREAAIEVQVALQVTRDFLNGRVQICQGAEVLAEFEGALLVSRDVELDCPMPHQAELHDLTVSVMADGLEILRYAPVVANQAATPPEAAVELPLPREIATCEELYLAGLHLQQYRHATRRPEAYWQEALRRDHGDSRSNHAMGLWHLRRGEYAVAEEHLQRATARQTKLNTNPKDGSFYYSLGLALRAQHRNQEAYAAFYKASWNFALRAPSYHALAELDAAQQDWASALAHLDESLRVNTENLNARNLAVIVRQRLGRDEEARRLLARTCQLDPLDIWSRFLDSGEDPGRLDDSVDNQLRLDLALDYARAGLRQTAIAILESADTARLDGSVPLVLYTLAWLFTLTGDTARAEEFRKRAAEAQADYCFPSRLEEIEILETAITANPGDARALYYLGNLFYDRRRYAEAIALWERSTALDPGFATVWRNLGFAYFNIQNEPKKAREAFDRASSLNPQDARVLYERDQLSKRTGEMPEKRLQELERYPHMLALRDDLAAEVATLYNHVGRLEDALQLLRGRKFQPWEGGEGLVLSQWSRANLLSGQRALEKGDAAGAVAFFQAAMTAPDNLGEAKHLLANESEVYYWLGVAWQNRENQAEAEKWWKKASSQRGDFQQMQVQKVSDKTFWNVLSLEALGQHIEALELFRSIERFSDDLEKTEPKIDYFATSLPAMLLFEEDLGQRNRITATFLCAQALLGIGRTEDALQLLQTVLSLDANHAPAADLFKRVTTVGSSWHGRNTCTSSTLPR